ncbi:hypothetical protein Taro_033521, partial [Colocasia esculenta]|nr:hypothetical protein [Colocasia esculenta]
DVTNAGAENKKHSHLRTHRLGPVQRSVLRRAYLAFFCSATTREKPRHSGSAPTPPSGSFLGFLGQNQQSFVLGFFRTARTHTRSFALISSGFTGSARTEYKMAAKYIIGSIAGSFLVAYMRVMF